MKSLPKSMLKPRKARVEHGCGEAWYYITPTGLEICVANAKGEASRNIVKLTHFQMQRALEIIEAEGCHG